MPLLYICATSASSWSFTESSLSGFFVICLFVFGPSTAAQPGHTLAKLLPDLGRSQPAGPTACRPEIHRQVRSRQLLGFRSKGGHRQKSRSHDHCASNQTKRSTQRTIHPAKSCFMNRPSHDPGDGPRKQNDSQKNGQETRQVGKGLSLDVRQKPRRNLAVAPDRQQVTENRSRERNDLEKKSL